MDPSAHRGSPSHPLPNSHNDRYSDYNLQTARFARPEPPASFGFFQPTRRHDRSSAVPSSAALPSVYWDSKKNSEEVDRESDANLAGYTFYREPTPPPPECEDPEKRVGHGRPRPAIFTDSSTVGGGTIRSDGDHSQRPLNHGEAAGWGGVADHNSRVISPAARRKALWAAGALILIAVAVGVGVGLGVGLKAKGGATEPTDTPPSSIPDSEPDKSPIPTATTPTMAPGGAGASADPTTGSPPAPRPTYNSDCPALNNTIYHVPGSTKSFLRVCGIDYSGSGATDLVHTWTNSMADCMNSCASFDQCTGCAWGYLDGDDGPRHRCYMKKDLTKPHQAVSDWCFAILQ
ncbi:hypothetical protein VTH06DRAFT_8699 [Thermothelomyces fergusii]